MIWLKHICIDMTSMHELSYASSSPIEHMGDWGLECKEENLEIKLNLLLHISTHVT
jgi:hypothetical protein